MQRNFFKTTRPLAKLQQGRNEWYRIENKSSDVATVYIYEEIGFFGVTAQDFVKDLNNIQSDTIQLRMNTPGGDVFDAVTIYNGLKDHPATINAVVDGAALSAGSFILQAADNRAMNQGSQVMIHDAHGLAIGNATDMQEMAALLDKQSDNIAEILATRSGQDLETVRDAMRAETWYSAQEAVDFGLADEVLPNKAADNTFDLSIFNYQGRANAPRPVVIEHATEFHYEQIRDALNGAFK